MPVMQSTLDRASGDAMNPANAMLLLLISGEDVDKTAQATSEFRVDLRRTPGNYLPLAMRALRRYQRGNLTYYMPPFHITNITQELYRMLQIHHLFRSYTSDWFALVFGVYWKTVAIGW